jgi:hypothetical protein
MDLTSYNFSSYTHQKLTLKNKSSGSVEYNVMATKMAPCAAAIFRAHHDILRGHAERTARAGRKILVFPDDRTRRFSS